MATPSGVFIGAHLDDDDHRLFVELQAKLCLELKRTLTTADLIRIALRDTHTSRVAKANSFWQQS